QGVTVLLYSDVNNNGVYDVGTDTFIESQVTDAGGKYLFQGLPDAKYIVKVDTSSTSLPTSFNPTSTFEQDGVHDSINAATITGGAAVVDRDFGYPLASATLLGVSGFVWNDQNNNSTRDAGGEQATFNNVTVRALVDLDGDGVADYTLTTTTSSAGAYAFTGIPNLSKVTIVVDQTTLPGAGWTQTTDPDATKDSQTTVSLAGSNIINQNFGYMGSIRVGNRIWKDDGTGTGGVANDGL
ncbi:MAG: hypothetical protein DVB31_16730, partial [Verrucomicrobia bacterium]